MDQWFFWLSKIKAAFWEMQQNSLRDYVGMLTDLHSYEKCVPLQGKEKRRTWKPKDQNKKWYIKVLYMTCFSFLCYRQWSYMVLNL